LPGGVVRFPGEENKNRLGGTGMEYVSLEELTEAKRQIDSVLHKTRQVLTTLEGKEDAGRYRSQITLAKRRIRAFEIANSLIEREMGQGQTA